MDKNYCIYKFTFSDGKIYIGQTNQTLENRWKNGEGYKTQNVYIPIILDGWENVKKEILHTNLTAEQANKLEKYYIKKYNSCEQGYNNTSGGGKITTDPIYIHVDFSVNLNILLQKSIPFAAQELKECGLKLFLYLLKFNTQIIIFQPAQICKECGLSRNSVKNGFDELYEKDFLTKIDINNYKLNLKE